MADIPLVETVDDALRRASQAVDALKRARPGNAAEGRVRAAELMRQQQDLIDAAHRVADGAATKRIASTNGHAANSNQGSGFTDAQVDLLARLLAPHFKAFDERIAALEARPALTYEGVWDAEKVYSVGSFTTEDGSLWHSQLDSNRGVRPGSNPDAWKLAVKHGRNARDSR